MALKTVDVTFQNLDSSEISLTDVSHYYDSDPTKVVSSLRDDKKKPSSFMADTTTANAQVLLEIYWYSCFLGGQGGGDDLSDRPGCMVIRWG